MAYVLLKCAAVIRCSEYGMTVRARSDMIRGLCQATTDALALVEKVARKSCDYDSSPQKI